MLIRLRIPTSIIFSFILLSISAAQVVEVTVKVQFNEWMDTTGFSNPNNFIWTEGLLTTQVELIDTATALLKVSEPEIYIWYTLKISNVYDRAGNVLCPDKDTIGCLWKSLPLPVELSSFTAIFIEERVQLNWITETEVNNYGFDIERNTDVHKWNKIGFIKGNGNSNSPKTYSFIDNKLVGGSKFQYRLKQIDTDGEYEYSEIVEVQIIPEDFTLYQNYPNPFNPITKIRYQLPKQCMVEIKIYDICGAEVSTLLNEKKEAGIYEIEFSAKGGSAFGGNATTLSSGVYFYRIIAGNFVQTKKMIILR